MGKKPSIPIGKSTSRGGKKNELYVPASMNSPDWKVKLWGEGGKLVKNFHDLSADIEVNHAKIVFLFDSGKSRYSSENLEEVMYRVVNPHPSSQEEWEEMEKEALSDFLINKSSDLVNQSRTSGNDLEYTFEKEKGKINLVVKSKGGEEKVIKSKNLKLKGKFYWKGPLKAKESVLFATPPKPAWWKRPTVQITILVVLGVILTLIVIFRKKIWSWIKGEKKKSKETIVL